MGDGADRRKRPGKKTAGKKSKARRKSFVTFKVLGHFKPHLAARDGGALCVWCSTPLDTRSKDATVDHVITQAFKGDDHIDNLILACRSCNSSRRHVPASTWVDVCRARGLAVREDVVREAITRASRRFLLANQRHERDAAD